MLSLAKSSVVKSCTFSCSKQRKGDLATELCSISSTQAHVA